MGLICFHTKRSTVNRSFDAMYVLSRFSMRSAERRKNVLCETSDVWQQLSRIWVVDRLNLYNNKKTFQNKY